MPIGQPPFSPSLGATPPAGPPPLGTTPPAGTSPLGVPPPPVPPSRDIFSAISTLALREQETAGDKVRRAVEILEEARDEDPKQAKILSMAIHVLRNGGDKLEVFQRDSDME